MADTLNKGTRDAVAGEQETPPCRLSDRQFTAVAKALSDPRRYSILTEVAAADGPFTCSMLREGEKVSAATISHHLKELGTAGLVDVTRDGKFAVLNFNRETFEAYLAQLSENLKPDP